jgi:hypothetical protein
MESVVRNMSENTDEPPPNLHKAPFGVEAEIAPVDSPVEAQDAEPSTEQVPANKKNSFMEAATSKALRPFVIISSSYLLFTITDGAIRMIVLLHAYNKAFSALEVAIMFSLYELAGVFTNLVRRTVSISSRIVHHSAG